jgi:thiamine-phosphate pyrophosphorylase
MALSKILNWLTGRSGENAAADGTTTPETAGELPFSAVISTPDIYPDEHEILERLFASGLSRFHLRKSRFSWRELREWVEAVPDELRSKIVVHAQPGLAREYALGGLHLRAGQRAPVEWPAEIPLSYACSNFEDLADARSPAYATIGPVFATENHRSRDRDSSPQRTPEEYAEILTAWKKRPDACPLLALGGITSDNIHHVRTLGFDGFAVVGSVWDADNPVAGFEALLDGWFNGK